MTINERAKIVRKTLGLTLEKFGEPLGVKKGAVSSWENGRTNITPQTFNGICQFWNVNPDWLKDGTGEMFIAPEVDTAYLVSELIENDDDEFYQAVLELVRTYKQLSPDAKKIIRDAGKQYINNLKSRKK